MLHYSCTLTALLEAPGCRRMIVDNGYLESLSRPNVTPVFTGIGEITENGIVGEDGRLVRFVWVPHTNPRPLSAGVHRPCDVIIMATGFQVVCICYFSLVIGLLKCRVPQGQVPH